MTIPYGKQNINEADIESVISVLRSDWLTCGEIVPKFEQAIANYVGSEYAVAVNSATSALHIACLSLGLKPGDWVWTSPNTFVASANCALYCGAKVDFVDVDPKTYNMSIEALSLKLSQAEVTGTLPKIVIPVHFAGQSCDMQEIHLLAKKYGFYVIEDASHAIGGSYKNNKIGGCQYSDIAIFSFHPVKIITTGEGGVAVTNNKLFANKMQNLRSHGITRNRDEMINPCEFSWYYEQINLGFNYRMTEMQAALGLSQLNRLDEFVMRRHVLAKEYDDRLQNLPMILPWQKEDTYSSFHLYVVQVEEPSQRNILYKNLTDAGILVNLHYIPVHLQPYYKNLSYNFTNLRNSEEYFVRAITLPLFFDLKKFEQEQIIELIKTFFKGQI